MSRGEDGDPGPTLGDITWSGVAINIGTIHCQPLLTTIRRQQGDKGTRVWVLGLTACTLSRRPTQFLKVLFPKVKMKVVNVGQTDTFLYRS